MQVELALMPQSGQMGYYFPWNSSIGDYDTSTFNPMYSDNQISSYDIEGLINALRTCPDYKMPSPKIMWGALLGVVLMVILLVALPVYLIGVGIFGGLFLGMTFFIMGTCERQKMLAQRRLQVNQVIANQAMTVFSPKRAILSLSPHQGYISIEFGWKNGMMNPGLTNSGGFGLGIQVPTFPMGMAQPGTVYSPGAFNPHQPQMGGPINPMMPTGQARYFDPNALNGGQQVMTMNQTTPMY